MPVEILHLTQAEPLPVRSKPQVARCLVAMGLLALAAFRISILLLLPLDLSGDEAYYWEWGQHLDWGYFSKPPGIGWLMGLASWFGLDSAAGIRSIAVLLGTASAWVLFLFAERLYDIRVAIISLLIFVANPASMALNAILTIDAPMVFCWISASYAFWRLRESRFTNLRWSGILIVALMAGLLCKQMMFAFFPIALASIFLESERHNFKKKLLLWIPLGVSLCVMIPPLVWNYAHQWVTVTHTLHHFEPGKFALTSILRRFFEFILVQAALLTPLLWALLVLVFFRAVRIWRTISAREHFLFLLSAPGLLVVAAMTFRQKINPNWPAVFYPAGLILLSSWAVVAWDLRIQRVRRFFPASVGLSIGITVISYALIVALSFGWLGSEKLNITNRLRGWSKLADEVSAVAATLPNPSRTCFITQSHRFLTSELAFYLPGHPRVYRFHESANIESQHDFWERPPLSERRNALIIVQGGRDQLSPALADNFESTTFLRELNRGGAKQRYALFLGRNLYVWP